MIHGDPGPWSYQDRCFEPADAREPHPRPLSEALYDLATLMLRGKVSRFDAVEWLEAVTGDTLGQQLSEDDYESVLDALWQGRTLNTARVLRALAEKYEAIP